MDYVQYKRDNVKPIVYTVNGGAENKLRDQLLVQNLDSSTPVDPTSEYIIVGFQYSSDTAGNFFFEDGASGNKIGNTHYFAANTDTPLIDCFLPFGATKPMYIKVVDGGNFSIIVYYMDKNYDNKKRFTSAGQG